MELDRLAAGVESKGNPLIFYETAPKLEHISAFNVAAQLISVELTAICKDFGNGIQILGKLRVWAFSYENREDSSQTLRVPKKIICKISEKIGLIVSHLPIWINHHLNLIDDITTRLPTELLQHFVWKWDGDVDYVLTAQNLINGDKLSDRERIKMMCAYCLKSELEKNYELLEYVLNRMTDEEFHANDYVFYWYSKINNARSAVSDDGDYIRQYERRMLNSRTAYNLNVNALAYFFSQILLNDKESAYDLCRNKLLDFHSFVVKFVMMNLTERDQIKLFELFPASRFMFRFIHDSCPHFALQFWNHVKDTMPGEQFVEMIRTIWVMNRLSWLKELAEEVWKSAPSHLKQFTFQYENGSFVFEWSRWFGNKIYRSPQFNFYTSCLPNDALTVLLKILLDADAEFKRRFWVQEWRRLIDYSRPDFLQRFFVTCLTDPLDISEFGRKIWMSHETFWYFRELIRSGNLLIKIPLLNQFLDIFAPDLNLKREAKIFLTNRLVDIPWIFASRYVVGSEEMKVMNVLIEFFQDIDQENKTNLVCRWIDKLINEENSYDSPDIVFDNILLVAERICDPIHRQIIAKKMPPKDRFISKGT